MDKIIIVLQDKQTIEKLAADPEVQIRIKDAIIDGIAKRHAKLTSIKADIVSGAQREIRDEFFGDTWRNVLKDEYKTCIREQAKTELNHLVSEELRKCSGELNKSISSWKEEVSEKLKKYDIEKIIREVAEKIIQEKFNGK